MALIISKNCEKDACKLLNFCAFFPESKIIYWANYFIKWHCSPCQCDSVGWSVILWTQGSWVRFLVGTCPWIAGSVPTREAYKRQPIKVSLSHWCFSLSKINNGVKNYIVGFVPSLGDAITLKATWKQTFYIVDG